MYSVLLFNRMNSTGSRNNSTKHEALGLLATATRAEQISFVDVHQPQNFHTKSILKSLTVERMLWKMKIRLKPFPSHGNRQNSSKLFWEWSKCSTLLESPRRESPLVETSSSSKPAKRGWRPHTTSYRHGIRVLNKWTSSSPQSNYAFSILRIRATPRQRPFCIEYASVQL